MSQLNIAALEEKAEQEKEDRFVVDDDQKANWALIKLRQLNKKREEKQEQAKKFKKEIDEWLEKETSSIENDIEFFEGLLTEYAMKKKQEDEDLKTHSLPAGDLKFRKQRPKWNYSDNELIESVKEAGLDDLVETKEKLKKREFKKRVEIAGDKVVHKETGEVIEGVEIKKRGEKFSVKVNN